MVKVENHPSLVKHDSGLVVDVDQAGYVKHMSQKKSNLRLVAVEKELNSIKTDILEIKQLLNLLIKGK